VARAVPPELQHSDQELEPRAMSSFPAGGKTKVKKLPSRVIFKKKSGKSRFFLSSLALALALFRKHNFGTERKQAQEQVFKKKN